MTILTYVGCVGAGLVGGVACTLAAAYYAGTRRKYHSEEGRATGLNSVATSKEDVVVVLKTGED